MPVDSTSELPVTLSSSSGLSASLKQELSHIMNTVATRPITANKDDLCAVDSLFPRIPTIKMVIKLPVHKHLINIELDHLYKTDSVP